MLLPVPSIVLAIHCTEELSFSRVAGIVICDWKLRFSAVVVGPVMFRSVILLFGSTILSTRQRSASALVTEQRKVVADPSLAMNSSGLRETLAT